MLSPCSFWSTMNSSSSPHSPSLPKGNFLGCKVSSLFWFRLLKVVSYKPSRCIPKVSHCHFYSGGGYTPYLTLMPIDSLESIAIRYLKTDQLYVLTGTPGANTSTNTTETKSPASVSTIISLLSTLCRGSPSITHVSFYIELEMGRFLTLSIPIPVKYYIPASQLRY